MVSIFEIAEKGHLSNMEERTMLNTPDAHEWYLYLKSTIV